jgi:phosphate transport system substrate-binding protein
MRRNIIFILFIVLASCSSKNKSYKDDNTPTSGKTTVYADSAFIPLVSAELDIFKSTYDNTNVNILYTNENECFKKLLEKKTNLIIVGRQFSPSEKEFIANDHQIPVENIVAFDGLAILLPHNAKDTTFTYDEIIEILSGKNQKYNIVFDQQNSGILNYVLHITKCNTPPKNAFAVKNNQAAIEYVNKNANSLAIVSIAWLSDSDALYTKQSLEKITLACIQPPKDFGDNLYYKPYSSNVLEGRYPLNRPICMLLNTRAATLPSGFASFVYSDIGQKIIAKSGLGTVKAQKIEVLLSDDMKKLTRKR